MPPNSRVIILPFKFSLSTWACKRDFRINLIPISGCKDDGFFKSGFVKGAGL
jgi:hypothetical protein